MKRTNAFLFSVISLIMILALASCSLPTITPPAEYDTSTPELPTETTLPSATPVPATSTPLPQPLAINTDNAAKLLPILKGPASNVQQMSWSADGKTLGLISQNIDANGNSTFSATILSGTELTLKAVWLAPNNGQFAAIGADGCKAAAISSDMRSVDVYDLCDSLRDIISLTPGYTVGNVTFSPDGKYMTVSDYDNMAANLINLPDGSLNKTLNGFTTAAPVFTVGFKGESNDLVWKARATLQLQNLASGALGPAFNHEDFVSDYQVSPDGTVLASAAGKTIDGDFKPAVTLWNTASGSELRTLVLENPAQSVSFSVDGTLLAVAEGNDVQVWETASGNLLATLKAHTAAVSIVAFSPDGNSLASVGQDNQLILWQVLPW